MISTAHYYISSRKPKGMLIFMLVLFLCLVGLLFYPTPPSS